MGYARRTYLVPIPQVASLAELPALNAALRARCLEDQQRIMAGQTASIAARLAVERAYLGPLPEQAPDLGLVRDVVVRSTGQVRFEANVYSVPIQYAYRHLSTSSASMPASTGWTRPGMDVHQPAQKIGRHWLISDRRQHM